MGKNQLNVAREKMYCRIASQTLMTDKAVLLGQFKCLESYEKYFCERFVISKYYPTYNFSWQ